MNEYEQLQLKEQKKNNRWNAVNTVATVIIGLVSIYIALK